MKPLNTILLMMIISSFIISAGCAARTPKDNLDETDIEIPAEVKEQIERLKSPDHEERESAAFKLGKLKDPRAIKPLISTLKDDELSVRQYSNVAIGKILRHLGRGDPDNPLKKEATSSVPLFLEILQADDPYLQRAAIYHLGIISDPRAVEPLIALLRKEGLAWEALKALEKTIDLDAAKIVVAAFAREKNQHFRKTLSRIIRNIKGPAVESLIFLLDNEDENIRRETASMLKSITGQDFGENHRKWHSWWEKSKGDYLPKKSVPPSLRPYLD